MLKLLEDNTKRGLRLLSLKTGHGLFNETKNLAIDKSKNTKLSTCQQYFYCLIVSYLFHNLFKGTLMQFESLPVCLRSHENNALEISHSYSKEFSSYFPVKFL